MKIVVLQSNFLRHKRNIVELLFALLYVINLLLLHENIYKHDMLPAAYYVAAFACGLRLLELYFIIPHVALCILEYGSMQYVTDT